jgi:hypothetical protein
MIRCFMIEPADRVRRTISVRSCTCEACKAAATHCPANPDGVHRAQADLGEFDSPYAPDSAGLDRGVCESLDNDALPWPTTCTCGAEIAQPLRSAGGWRYWRNTETGELYEGAHKAPPGAMYRAHWMRGWCESQDDGAPLAVQTPGGSWIVDEQASNCTISDDRHQDRHHCWPRRGVPPNVDVSKDYGPTCNAGAGSIQCGNYHGFLRDGHLT